MNDNITLYEDILILQESGQPIYIGSALLEDDDKGEDVKKGLFEIFKEKIANLFKSKSGNVKEVSDQMSKTNSKKVSKPVEFVKWFGSKIMGLIKGWFNTIIKSFKILWNWIKTHVPGVNTLSTKVAKMFGGDVNKQSTIADEKIDQKELIGFGVVTVVLVGVIGYIIKKLKENTSGAVNESTNWSVSTKPFALVESDGDISGSFTKKAPALFGKLLDFMKNIKDAAMRFIITTLGILVGVGLFVILGVITRPLVCRAMKFALMVDASGAANNISGMNKAKYVSARVLLAMADALGSKANTIIYDACDCIEWYGRAKKYIYDEKSGCQSLRDFKNQITAAANK